MKLGNGPALQTAPEKESAHPGGRRAIALNYLLLAFGECLAKVFSFLSFSHLARALGVGRFGNLEFVIAVMVFFTLPVDLGLGSYGAREVARDPGRARQLFREITGIRVLMALGSSVVLAVFVLLLHKPFEIKCLLAIYGVSLFGGPLLLQWFFQGHDLMHWVALASIMRQTVFAAGVLLFVRAHTPLILIGVIECCSVAAVALFCLAAVKIGMKQPLDWPVLNPAVLSSHLRQSMPIGFAEIAWAFMWYFCTVLLGLISSDWSLGWFGASHRTLMALHTFVWLYFFNLLPSISRTVGRPREHLLDLLDRSLRFTAWTGLLAAALLTVFAPYVLGMIYGWQFAGASGMFSILAWMLPVAMLSGHHRYTLIAYGCQKQLLWCTTASAIVAVTLGLALVPLFHGFGAAWSLLAANIVNFVLVYHSVRKLVVEVPVRRPLTGPLVSLGLAAAAYYSLRGWGFGIAVAAGVLAYGMGLVFSDGPSLAAFVRMLVTRRAEEAA